ncbi:MAG: hypothetical protein O2800_07950 [Planctomycetota bacterium]|nr:hypothetical protein [Planctomycetota bacterium]
MLTEQGTIVLKFFLFISNEEQRSRLQSRLDDPTKQWKFSINDVSERANIRFAQPSMAKARRGPVGDED